MLTRLNPEVRRTYETLPDLLKDFHQLVALATDRWNANITCSGDFHSFSFSADHINGFLNDTEPQMISQTYDNMEALTAELEHIRQYVNDHHDELGQVRLDYTVDSNGGHPVLHVYLTASKNPPVFKCTNLPCTNFPCDMPYRPYRDFILDSIRVAFPALLTGIPLVLIASYLTSRLH